MPPAPKSPVAPLAQGTLKPVANISLPNTNGAMLQKPMVAPSVNNQQPMTLTQAITYAKSNPTSDFANTLGGFIQRGDADQQAMQEGIDLSFAGRPSLQDMYSTHLNKNGVTMPDDSPLATLQKGYMDLINKASDNTAQQQKEAGQKIESSVTEGAQKIADDDAAADHGNDPEALLHAAEVPLGVASGAVQGIFAPITGIIQAISDKASDNSAVQEFAEKGTGPLLDLYDQLQSKIDEISKAHPEAAQNIGDSANVLLAALGGDETAAGKADVGAAQDATANAAREAAVGPPGGPPGGAMGAIRDAAGALADTVAKTAQDIGGGIAKIGETTRAGVTAPVKLVGRSAKSVYSNVYGLPADTTDFLLKHPQFATPEALGQESLANLGKEVEGKIAEKSVDVPKVADIAEEVKGGLQKKMQAVNEHALEYTKIANQNKAINVDKNWLSDQMQNKKIAGVEIDAKGRVTHGDADAAIRPSSSPEGARALQDLWDTWGPIFQSGKMTYKQFLSFRQDLAQIADYKGGVDTALEKSAHAIRDKFNTTYRKKLPGMQDLDAEHTRLERDLESSLTGLATIDKTSGLPKIKMNEGAASNILNADKETKGELTNRLENISSGITKKIQQRNAFADKYSDIVDENGKLKENALGNIKNSINFTKDLKLDKLKELMPEITDRIRRVKAAEDFHAALGPKAGLYGRQGIAATGALIGHSIIPFVGAVPGWLAGMYAASPEMGLRVLRAMAKMKGN